jgi:aminomethyltransferase
VEVLRLQNEEGTPEKLVAFVMDDKGIPRQGMAIEEGGTVTSGTLSPMLDQGIGLAYVDSARAAPETKMTVDLRGRPRAAHIVKKPIYKREE